MFKWVPGSAWFTVLRRVYDSLVPALVTLISVGLFDSAARALKGEGDTAPLLTYAALYLLAYLITDLSAYASAIVVACNVYERGTSNFRLALHEKITRLPLIAFEDAQILNMLERAQKAVDSETLAALFCRIVETARSAVATISVAAVLSRYSVWLLPLSLLSVLPYLFARLIRGREFYYVKRSQSKKTRLQTYLWNLFSTRQTAKEMRVMGFDGYITDKWRDTRDEVNEELWAVDKKDAKSLLLCDAIRIAGWGISVAVVLYLVVRGNISLGVFGASVTAFVGLQSSMKSFLEDFGRIPEQIAYANDYYAFLDMPEERGGGLEFPGLREEIRLENVSFRYPNSEGYALNDISLAVRKGEKIAVLGENGSGKTTLSKVMLGLYEPQSGGVLYDGTPVSAFSKSSFYRDVSAIAQDFVSYNLSLRENIAISDTARLCADGEIARALREGGLDGVGALDDSMGREFGGKELSGGQWQKLAIARGLFKDSELILLDEPTAALDPLIETELLAKFVQAAKGKTALIVSHRVGLCRLVDRIVVMKDGKIAECGRHDELMRLRGEYARLYTAQEQWYR